MDNVVTPLAQARALGINYAQLQHRGRHALLIGEAERCTIRIAVPLAPSDWSAGRNLKADMRRAVVGRK